MRRGVRPWRFLIDGGHQWYLPFASRKNVALVATNLAPVGRHSRCDQRHGKSSTYERLRHSKGEGLSHSLRLPYVAPKLLHSQIDVLLTRRRHTLQERANSRYNMT